MNRLAVFIGLLALFFVFLPALQAPAQDDEDCFFCHGEPGMTMEKDGQTISLYVDAEVFSHSVHGEAGCVSCHSDIEEVPHEAGLKPVECGDCHGEAEEYVESLHGVALRNGDTDVARCNDCHGTHDILPASDPASMVYPRNLPETCGRCHSDPVLVRKHMISVRNPSDSYMKSTHAKVIASGNLDAASCNDCHGTHDLLPSQDPKSKVNRFNIAGTCGECHAEIVAEYAKSIHGQALEAGIKDAPTCIDCHGEHDIEAAGNEDSSVNRQQISRSTCPRCHDDEKVMKRYGIETMRQASYMDSYHGMASAAGSEVVASCTSCHGVHNILPHSDPASSTYQGNLVKTCGQCHEDAGPNFAIGRIHVMPTDPKQRALGIVRLVYILLIIATIGGMVFHNTLMMGRHAFTKFKAELGGPNTYKRFNLGQTIGHLVLTVAFIALALSGFALRYPDAWWASALFHGDAGLAARGLVHRIAAIVLVLLSVVNAVYLLCSKSGRKELHALIMWPRDIMDMAHNMLFVAGIAKTEPRFGRYSYIEKFEYWGMWWGTLVMVITGLCMWFVNHFLHYFPKVVLDAMALIHFYEAWLAVLTITVWHMYYMVLDPHTYPMNWSWITGHITEEDFKARHPLEYEEVTADEPLSDGK